MSTGGAQQALRNAVDDAKAAERIFVSAAEAVRQQLERVEAASPERRFKATLASIRIVSIQAAVTLKRMARLGVLLREVSSNPTAAQEAAAAIASLNSSARKTAALVQAATRHLTATWKKVAEKEEKLVADCASLTEACARADGLAEACADSETCVAKARALLNRLLCVTARYHRAIASGHPTIVTDALTASFCGHASGGTGSGAD